MQRSYSYDYVDGGTGKETELRQSVTDPSSVTTAYDYDALNRLKEADRSSTGAVDFSYAYDRNSNITSKTLSGTTTTYTHNDADELTQAGSVTYSHDGAGNMTGNSAGLALAYNAKNHTTSITPAGGSQIAFDYRGATQDERISGLAEGEELVEFTRGFGPVVRVSPTGPRPA